METGLINRRKHILSAIFTILALATTQVIAQRVETEPQKATLVEGEKTSLLCRSGTKVQYCRIEIPGEPVLNLSPVWPSKTPGFTYYGAGLDAGQCGVTIERVSARNHGRVKCSLGVEGLELPGEIELVVALTPHRPELEILSKPPRDNFQVNDLFRAKCISRDGRPAANITWFIGDEPVREGLGMPEYIDLKGNTSLWTTSQEIRRNLQASDDGKFLTCQSVHIADRGRDNTVKYQFSVKYIPQPLPDIKVYGLTLSTTAFINVTIRANPRPRIEWVVDGISIPQSTQNSRYESYEPIDLGNGEYNVTLSIAGLTLEDTTKDYYLKASNEMGLQEYTVRISSSNTPASTGLEIGAIIGIVVAVAILLIIVLLIVFARATGRWCFGAKSSKPVNSETIEGGQPGPEVALLNNPNKPTVTISNTNHKINNIRSTHPSTNSTNGQRDVIIYHPSANVPANDQYINFIPKISGSGPPSTIDSSTMDNGDGTVHNNNLELYPPGSCLGIPERKNSLLNREHIRLLLERQAEMRVNRGTRSTDIY